MEDVNKFIKENLNLVHYIIEKYNLPKDEDMVQIGMIGLWRAYETYDESKGYKFSTYASKIILNQLLLEVRRRKRYSRLDIISFEDVVCRGEDGCDIKVSDTLESKGDLSNLVIDLSSLTDRESKILDLCYEGYTQREIGDMLNISQPQISRIIKKIKEKIV